MIRAIFSWAAFAAGIVLVLAGIVTLHINGATLLGVLLLVLWLWGLGGLRLDFWVQTIPDTHPDALGSRDIAERSYRKDLSA